MISQGTITIGRAEFFVWSSEHSLQVFDRRSHWLPQKPRDGGEEDIVLIDAQAERGLRLNVTMSIPAWSPLLYS